MTTTWCVKCSRIYIKKSFLYPLTFSFHSRPIIISLSMYIINIKLKNIYYIYNFKKIVSSTFTNSTKCSTIFIGLVEISTHRNTRDICSWWLAFGVKSSIIEKYFNSLIFLIILYLISFYNRYRKSVV